MAGVTKIPQQVASHHRNQTPHILEPPPLAPGPLPPPGPPKKPSRWLKRKNPSLPIIIGRSGTSPDDEARWQPLRFFTFILSRRLYATRTPWFHFYQFIEKPASRSSPQAAPTDAAMPTRVEQCPNHSPCIIFRCTRGSHKLLGRHEHAAVQAPTTPRWTPPSVPCRARSPPSPTLRWRRLFLCHDPSRLCRPSQKGNRKSPKRGPVRTRSRRGNPSSLGRYHPRGRPETPPIGRNTAHPAGRKPVRSRQCSLSNFCPHGTRELLDRRGAAAASTVKSH